MKKLLMMLTVLTVLGTAVMAQSSVRSTATSKQIASTSAQGVKPGKHKQGREKSGKHSQKKATHDQEMRNNKHKG